MPGNDERRERQKLAPSSINLDAVRDQFLTFCQKATCSADGTVHWPVQSIRKSLGLSSESAESKIDPVKQNSDDEGVIRVSKSSSFDSSLRQFVSETSIYDQDSSSPTYRLEKVFHLSNVRLCPADMSPPAESRLLKGKLKRNRNPSWTSDVENSPQKKPNQNVVDEKSDSDIDDESSLSPQTPKVSRLSVRDLNKEFSPEIQSKSTFKKGHNYRIVSSEDTSDETDKKSNSYECLSAELDESDSENESDVAVDPAEDSAELFRSPHKNTVRKQSEPTLLATPRTEARTTRSSTRLSSARKLFPTQDDKPEPQIPRTPKSIKHRKINVTPKVNVKLLTPSRGRVESPLRTPTTPRDRAKHALALSAAPESLPCRGKEFQTVYDFVREKISSKESGVLCINGVPGSGKTATIRRVLKKLMTESEKKALNKFKAIEVNAFDLRKSKEIYRKIYEQLTNERKTVTIAEQLLTEKFQSQKRNANRVPVVLIIDEFDCLLAKKRDVIYKMVEWQACDNSQLVLLTIANKLDFSDEKKLFSRIKFERLAFVAYSFQELEVIIQDRLKEFHGFKPEAIQFIARKVAATSGDARKALDICRQVLDTVEAEDEKFVFTIDYVSKLLEKIFSNPNLRIIRQLTDLEKIALRALRDELMRTDKAFCSLWNGVWHQFEAICNMDGFTRINCNSLLQIYSYLASIGLVKIETDHLDQHSKIWLKCDTDVIKVALK